MLTPVPRLNGCERTAWHRVHKEINTEAEGLRRSGEQRGAQTGGAAVPGHLPPGRGVHRRGQQGRCGEW